MIICHFFTRTIKGTSYLMVASSSDQCAKTHPYPSPTILFEAVGERRLWVPRARDAVMASHPYLLPGDPCLPDDKRPNQKQCFDVPFYEQTDAV